MTSVTDPDGNITTSVYDADGEVTDTIDPNGARATLTYDADGEITSMVDFDNRLTDYAYDAEGARGQTSRELGVRLGFWLFPRLAPLPELLLQKI